MLALEYRQCLCLALVIIHWTKLILIKTSTLTASILEDHSSTTIDFCFSSVTLLINVWNSICSFRITRIKLNDLFYNTLIILSEAKQAPAWPLVHQLFIDWKCKIPRADCAQEAFCQTYNYRHKYSLLYPLSPQIQQGAS